MLPAEVKWKALLSQPRPGVRSGPAVDLLHFEILSSQFRHSSTARSRGSFSLERVVVVLKQRTVFRCKVVIRRPSPMPPGSIRTSIDLLWRPSCETLRDGRFRYVFDPSSVIFTSLVMDKRLATTLPNRLRTKATKLLSKAKSRTTQIKMRIPFSSSSTSEKPAPFLLQVLSEKVSRLSRNPYRQRKGFIAPTSTNPVQVMASVPVGFHRNNPTSDLTSSHLVEKYYRSAVGVDTPNFRRVRKANLPVNPYDLQVRKGMFPLVFEQVSSRSEIPQTRLFGYNSLYAGYISMPSYAPSFSTTAYNKALNKLIDRAQLSKSNWSETLATYRQTNMMIGSSISRLVKSVRAVRRGQFGTASKLLFNGQQPRFRKGFQPSASKSLANNWLAYQYGWKPLLNDIRNTVELYASLTASTSPIIEVSARGFDKAVGSSDIMGPLSVSLATVSPFKVGTSRKDTRWQAHLGIRYSLSDQQKAFLSQTGFTSPVSLAWELVPFSFVVDWFLPIGNFLSSFSAFEGFQFHSGWVTESCYEEFNADVDFAGWKGTAPQDVDINCSGSNSCSQFTLRRQRLMAFPGGRFPEFKNPLSFTHSLNALALLRSAMKS